MILKAKAGEIKKAMTMISLMSSTQRISSTHREDCTIIFMLSTVPLIRDDMVKPRSHGKKFSSIFSPIKMCCMATSGSVHTLSQQRIKGAADKNGMKNVKCERSITPHWRSETH